MSPTASMQINRNLRPAGAPGNAGTGASISSSLLFSPIYHHDTDNAYVPPLAIARAGGKGGQIYVYSEDGTSTSGYASFAGGGRRWGDNVVDQSSENPRDPLTSYLHQHFSPTHSAQSSQSYRPQSHIPSTSTANLLTPPSSFTQSVAIPRAAHSSSSHAATSLPLTPLSLSNSAGHHKPPSPERCAPTPAGGEGKPDHAVTTLISSVFPQHAPTISLLSSTLEVLTPPSHTLHGFIVDPPSPSPSGRTVFIYLPPAPFTQHQRPEALSPNFSQVLRPHDPLLSTSPPNRYPTPTSSSPASSYALDIRESLTALLDLASEALEASNLVLVLDRDEREQEGLGELLHSLMYVGGQVVKPGALEGGWEWDVRKWVLVGMEL
ncbi:hypothetical protein IAT38_005777 [Cryptococcus sp. DSM 104549]